MKSGSRRRNKNDNSELTNELIKTSQLMKENLEQSINNHKIWNESSDLISSTLNQYVNFDELLIKSKSILRLLERGNILDKIAIIASILFFILCVLVVLKRRVFDKGLTITATLLKPFTYIYSSSKHHIESQQLNDHSHIEL